MRPWNWGLVPVLLNSVYRPAGKYVNAKVGRCRLTF
jgi:hypothetical protein